MGLRVRRSDLPVILKFTDLLIYMFGISNFTEEYFTYMMAISPLVEANWTELAKHTLPSPCCRETLSMTGEKASISSN